MGAGGSVTGGSAICTDNGCFGDLGVCGGSKDLSFLGVCGCLGVECLGVSLGVIVLNTDITIFQISRYLQT